MPLVLVYPGAGATAVETEGETDFNQATNQRGIVVAYLQGYDDTWNEGTGHTPAEQAHVNDVAFTKAVIDHVEKLYPIKRSQIIAVGFSNGALMVQELGCEMAGTLGLIVPVEGEIPRAVSSACHPSQPISLFEIHGTSDATIPYTGGVFYGIAGTTVLSAPASAERWATLDHCSLELPQSVATPFITAYGGCHDDATVRLETVPGGTHQWPTNIGDQVVGAMLSRTSGDPMSMGDVNGGQ